MSKLSKKNRQVRKQAPTKAVGAIAAVGAKVLPAIAKFAASNPEATKKAGGFLKNMIANRKNKNQSNDVASEESKSTNINSSSGPFGAYQPLAAPMSPVAKIANIDAKALNHDVVGSNMKISGSSSDPTKNVPNTAAGAVAATKQNSAVIDGTTYTTSESTAAGVNSTTGNMSKPQASNDNKSKPTSGSKSTSNPNTADEAIKSSKSTNDGINTKFNPNLIGGDTQYGRNHKPYWEDVSKDPNKPKWKKRNIIIVKDVEGEIKKGKKISRTNPFNKPKAEKPVVTGGVKADLNKKSDIPTEMSYKPAEAFANPNADTKWSRLGLNEMQAAATASLNEGDEAGYKHFTNIINNTRLKHGLNNTRKTNVNSSSALGNGPDMKNAALHTDRSKPLSGSGKIDSNVKGNTSTKSNKAPSGKPEIITNKNGTFRRVKDANNVVTSFEKISSLGGDNVFNLPKKKKADFSNFAGISPFDPNKKINVQGKLSKDPGITSTTNIASGQGSQFNPTASKPKTAGSKPKQVTSTSSSPKQTGGKGAKKVKKDLLKEKRKSDRSLNKNTKRKNTKTNKRRRGSNGLVKVGKNPLFSSKT